MRHTMRAAHCLITRVYAMPQMSPRALRFSRYAISCRCRHDATAFAAYARRYFTLRGRHFDDAAAAMLLMPPPMIAAATMPLCRHAAAFATPRLMRRRHSHVFDDATPMFIALPPPPILIDAAPLPVEACHMPPRHAAPLRRFI